MKKNSNLLFFFLALFSLQSCVSYRPSVFDVETKRYNDFKRNYSIKILDGYNLISSDLGKTLRKSFFPSAPKDTATFYNKTNETFLVIFVMDDQILSQYEKKQLINAMEEGFYRIVDKCKECSNLKILKNSNELIVELNINDELRDTISISKMVPFPLSQNGSHHGVFALIGVATTKEFKEFKKVFFNMGKSVKLPAFNESERKLN